MELLHSGKVRDVYGDGDDLLLVASDRISVYDVVLPTPIPDKGAVLTQLSLWWFERLADVVPQPRPVRDGRAAECAGRAVRCRRLTMVPVECIARGYLAGLGLASTARRRRVGVPLPPGWSRARGCPSRSSRRPRRPPAAASTTSRSRSSEVAALVGADDAARAAAADAGGLRRGAELAAERGVIVADTKLEFGRDAARARWCSATRC